MLKFYHDQSLRRKIICLIGGFIIHIVIGTVYITGNISPYIASYLQAHGSEISLKDVSIILPLQILGTSMTLIFGSFMTAKLNPWM